MEYSHQILRETNMKENQTKVTSEPLFIRDEVRQPEALQKVPYAVLENSRFHILKQWKYNQLYSIYRTVATTAKYGT